MHVCLVKLCYLSSLSSFREGVRLPVFITDTYVSCDRDRQRERQCDWKCVESLVKTKRGTNKQALAKQRMWQGESSTLCMHVYVLFMGRDISPFRTHLILLTTIFGEALFLSLNWFFGALNITCELPSSSIILERMQINCTTVQDLYFWHCGELSL